ncbi:hypothetical protein PILCRDRAFT_2732 [Piloderma croceum F 1598]|uniref:Uncharacterized protein n=1 Tax=Piloderma croceum (strain F 1598) TaxID=765440 RepID=A0A0C3G9U1_PILCF|nr:hypothetical protein PILCRDRAFT_2732 [Piloderma croceum F 1598]
MIFSVVIHVIFATYIPFSDAYILFPVAHNQICIVSSIKLLQKQPSVALPLSTQNWKGLSHHLSTPTVSSGSIQPPSSPLSPILTKPILQTPPSPNCSPQQPLTASPSTPSTQSSPASSSSSSSSSDTPNIPKTAMPSQLRTASVKQNLPLKVPLLLPGDISPTIMHKYEYACLGYFNTKDVGPNKQVRKILA